MKKKQIVKDSVSFWLPLVGLTVFALVYGFMFATTSLPKF